MSLARRFQLWSGAVALLLAVFAFDVVPHFKLETNILALLPPSETDVVVDRALDRFSDLLGRDVVFLIGAADFDSAKRIAAQFAATLQGSPAFSKLRFQVDTNYLAETSDSYLPYRDGLLSTRMRHWLAAGDDAQLLGAAQQALYSPAAFLRRSGAGDDPLNVFGDFLSQASMASGRLSLRDGVLTTSTTAPAREYVMVSAVLAGDAFATNEQDLARPVLADAIDSARAEGATVAGAGFILHSIAAAGLARHEIDLFGGIQFAGLLLVLWWVFRSGRMLWLSAATLAVGVVAALTVSHYVFAKLQVLALVFCSNLAGVAIDYSIYYCADQFRTPGRWRAADASSHIGPAITMSCAATVLSYALLAVAPFPGLRQGALFCCIGLAAAYACVMAWFPRWVMPAPLAPAQRTTDRFERLLRVRERIAGRPVRWLWPLLVLFIALGLTRLHFVDDIRILQPDTPVLSAEEEQVRDLVGNLPDGRFFLVRGSDPQDVLRKEEQLTARLDELINGPTHAAASYSAVSQALPSLARQQENHQLLAEHVFAGKDGGLLAGFMKQLGFDDAAIAQRKQAFAGSKPLTPSEWLATPASEPYRHLWLGDIGGSYASVVTLADVHDVAALQAAARGVPGVRVVDRVREISGLLKRYRQRAMVLVAIAAFASALLLALAYGWRRGFRLMATPVAACLATLAVFGFTAVPVTFFHIVALHLVMGLSMEYAILLSIAELRSPAVLLSATLAAALALLAFGLLALSSTPFIHSLGISVSIGVLFGYVFALLVGTLAPDRSAARGAGSR
ncbi:MAG: hypothetical protein JWR16_1597 [Nevskia sp.]|nr:hypothetical protein [Nevskia sp.]